ncbi:MAG: hypothetical protein H6679_00865 [Epsilonproteobacteria bacterium]|nr:hypothetical protein [Campylobacterota bacterium]
MLKKIIILTLAALINTTTHGAEKQQHLYNFLCYLKQTVHTDNHPNIVKNIAFGCYETLLRLYTQKYGVIKIENDEAVGNVLFSPNGKLIVCAACPKPTVTIHSLESRHSVKLNHDKVIHKIEFSPCSKLITTISRDKSVAKLWSIKGDLVAQLQHDGLISDITFNPCNKLIATASHDGSVKLWSHEGKLLKKLIHNGTVPLVVFSANGNLLATASKKTLKLWTSDGDLQRNLEHPEEVKSFVLSPCEKFIAVATHDNNSPLSYLYLRNINGEYITKTAQLVNTGPPQFSQCGKFLVTVPPGQSVQLLHTDGKTTTNLPHPKFVSGASLSPCGKLVVTTDHDGAAYLWKTNGDFLQKLNTDLEKSISTNYLTTWFSPCGKLIILMEKYFMHALCKANGKLITIAPEDTTPLPTFSPCSNYVSFPLNDRACVIFPAVNFFSRFTLAELIDLLFPEQWLYQIGNVFDIQV